MANGGIIGPVQNPSFGDETINTFTEPGTYNNPNIQTTADILVVGGGGSGRRSSGSEGGGGAGGYRYFPATPITGGTSYPITVGTAGGQDSPGGSSQFGGPSTPAPETIAASGGGMAGGRHQNGSPGGSGGGAGDGATPGPVRSGGSGNSGGYSPPEGNNGGNGTPSPLYEPAGGGGGAGGAGGHGGPPGAGAPNTITGTDQTYSRGGSGQGDPSYDPNQPPAQPGGIYGAGANTGSDGSSGPADNQGRDGVVIIKTGAFSDASGVWNLNDVVTYRKEGQWGS